jgi:hypothetical protein
VVGTETNRRPVADENCLRDIDCASAADGNEAIAS